LLEAATGVRVGKSTIGRISQKLNYSVKKKPYTLRKKKRCKKKRVDYWKIIKEVKAEDLVFIDESGVNLAMVRLYAISLKGTRARGKKLKSEEKIFR